MSHRCDRLQDLRVCPKSNLSFSSQEVFAGPTVWQQADTCASSHSIQRRHHTQAHEKGTCAARRSGSFHRTGDIITARGGAEQRQPSAVLPRTIRPDLPLHPGIKKHQCQRETKPSKLPSVLGYYAVSHPSDHRNWYQKWGELTCV